MTAGRLTVIVWATVMIDHATDAPAPHRYQMPTVQELPRRWDPDSEGADAIARSRVESEARASGAVADSG